MTHPLTESWVALHHVQLAIPPGSEDACRAFYVDILGMTEVPKPTNLAKRGGLWLHMPGVEIHLGVETNFRPARKAHPSFVVTDVDAVAAFLSAKDAEVVWDRELPDRQRFYTYDNLGNRIEIMQATNEERANGYCSRAVRPKETGAGPMDTSMEGGR